MACPRHRAALLTDDWAAPARAAPWQSACGGGRQGRIAQDLDGGETAEAGPFGEVHHNHAAPAQRADDFIRADTFVYGESQSRSYFGMTPFLTRNSRIAE